MVINDIGYNLDIIESQILTKELFGYNPEKVDTIENNPNNILEGEIDPNKDENVSQEENFEETRHKHKSKLSKNHPISKVTSNMNEYVVTRRQSRLNEMGLVCYTSQLELQNMEEALGDEYWTTTLQEELNQFTRNDVCT